MGKVINVKKLNVNTLIGHGALMSKRELSLNVDRFGQGALRSKHKLSLNVDRFGQGALRSKHKLSLNDTFVGNFFKQMKV